MQGPFGGELDTSASDAATERHPGSVATTFPVGEARDVPASFPNVDLVTAALDDTSPGSIRYSRPFDTWTPLRSGPSQRDVLAALGAVANALAELHARDQVHGDLTPRAIGWRSFEGSSPAPTLIVTPNAAAGSHLRARILHELEPLAALAYLAPETLPQRQGDREPPTRAADVFALAAIAYEAISGLPALGQLDTLAYPSNGPLGYLANALRAALSADPSHRPTASQLAPLLIDMANHAPDPAHTAAPEGPYRAHAGSPGPHSPAFASPAQRMALQANTAQMSGILMVLLAIGGAFVFFGAIWLVSVNWSALGELGHFALLVILTCGAAVGSHVVGKRGDPGTGTALTLLASRLLWADAAYLLDISEHSSGSGPWAVAAAFVSACSGALVVWKRTSIYAWMAAIDLAILAGFVGDFLSTGAPLGPATYSALVGIAFVGVAASAARLRAKESGPLGFPFAVFAVACAWISAASALALFDRGLHELFATCWPYAIGAVGAGAWWALRRAAPVYKWCGAAVLLPVLLFVPSIETIAHAKSGEYLIACVVIGFALLGAMQIAPMHDFRDTALALLGIVNIAAMASIMCLSKCSDVPADEALAGGAALYFGLWIVGAAGLVGAGYIASARAVAKPTYRVLEAAGLIEFFGVATLLSLFRDQELFYPALVFVGGALLLGAGVATRRATLVVGAAVALLVNLAFQYFLRLHLLLPTAVLVIGFGVGLLAFGFAYERRIKQLVPLLRVWS